MWFWSRRARTYAKGGRDSEFGHHRCGVGEWAVVIAQEPAPRQSRCQAACETHLCRCVSESGPTPLDKPTRRSVQVPDNLNMPLFIWKGKASVASGIDVSARAFKRDHDSRVHDPKRSAWFSWRRDVLTLSWVASSEPSLGFRFALKVATFSIQVGKPLSCCFHQISTNFFFRSWITNCQCDRLLFPSCVYFKLPHATKCVLLVLEVPNVLGPRCIGESIVFSVFLPCHTVTQCHKARQRLAMYQVQLWCTGYWIRYSRPCPMARCHVECPQRTVSDDIGHRLLEGVYYTVFQLFC